MPTIIYEYEHTDTFNGGANYGWVKRGKVEMPELTRYGYDGSANTYSKANKTFRRELIRAVKAATGLTGLKCRVDELGDEYHIYPSGMAQVVFVTFKDHV